MSTTDRIEHADISVGDRIVLAGEPATVEHAYTSRGYRVLDIRRDNGARGRWYVAVPVRRETSCISCGEARDGMVSIVLGDDDEYRVCAQCIREERRPERLTDAEQAAIAAILSLLNVLPFEEEDAR